MQWEFTPEDVVKAEADYGLEEFRRDLAQEAANNLPPADPARMQGALNLIYDLCYALATRDNIEPFLDSFAYDPPTVEFLRELAPHMADNAAMLGAILQRQIMNRIEKGMTLDQAIEDVASWHQEACASAFPL